MSLSPPGIRLGPELLPASFHELRREALFRCCKWDPQVEDVEVLASFPILLTQDTWQQLASAAEVLTAEALDAEAELLNRLELLGQLGLPRAVVRAIRSSARGNSAAASTRVFRFDFHPTRTGWQISEANTDVPGGYNEASGYTALMAAQFPGMRTPGDPVAALTRQIQQQLPPNGTVGLVHATAYADDRQVMAFLERALAARGHPAVLTSPDNVEWRQQRPWGIIGHHTVPLDFLFRFFPAEWLPNLRNGQAWLRFFGDAGVPLCNPGTALVTQTKRFPLAWDRLRTPLTMWRQWLPATIDPRAVPRSDRDQWVFKPALGRVGEGIGIAGVTEPAAWRRIRRSVAWFPRHWAAQRRFESVGLDGPNGVVYPCVGVYTVGGEAAGAYGRIATRPLIDHRAQETAVLVETPRPAVRYVPGPPGALTPAHA